MSRTGNSTILKTSDQKQQRNTAIVIITHKPSISNFELVSLRQCFKIFYARPIFIVCPERMDISEYLVISDNVQFSFVPPKYLESYRNFNRFKILPYLYKKFENFKYLLFYELDAFVFRDELDLWIAKGYDYIGAPWRKGWTDADKNSPFIGVGNGGFSLRKVKSHIQVLKSFSYICTPNVIARRWLDDTIYRKFRSLPYIIADLTIRNNTHFLFNNFTGNEDVFWGLIADRNFNWFNVAPIEEAIKFSFEVQPRDQYIQNRYNLPFGCHGWWKYDLEFWRPFIENEGYNL
jgi:hypothetical protein